VAESRQDCLAQHRRPRDELVGGFEQSDDGPEVRCRERLLAGAHERVIAPSCLVACADAL